MSEQTLRNTVQARWDAAARAWLYRLPGSDWTRLNFQSTAAERPDVILGELVRLLGGRSLEGLGFAVVPSRPLEVGVFDQSRYDEALWGP